MARQLGKTYTTATATTSTSATATARAATTASGLAAAGTLTLDGTLGLLARLGLAGELDGDLALEDLLAGELSDGALGLAGGREVDEGVTDRAVGARVLRDGNRLTAGRVSVGPTTKG